MEGGAGDSRQVGRTAEVRVEGQDLGARGGLAEVGGARLLSLCAESDLTAAVIDLVATQRPGH